MKTLALRIYRRLAFSFPHEFQMVYGADVLQLGEDVIPEIWQQHGIPGLLRLLFDIAWRLPIEYLAEMRRDLHYAFVTLRRARAFAIIGVLSLGLGIGLAAVSASEFFGLILRDMPGAKDADRLAMVMGVSYPAIDQFRDRRDLFASAAAYHGPLPFNISLSSSDKNQRVFGHLVSPEYFSVIGVSPARGRTFDPQLEKPGAPPAVFISDRFWRNRLDSDPNAVGRSIRVNGQTATIVGIGPKDFLGVIPVAPAEIFVPSSAPEAMVPELTGDVIHNREAKSFRALLRLAPGVNWLSAEAAVDTLVRNLEPDAKPRPKRMTLLPGGRMMPIPSTLRSVLLTMTLLMDGMILAIACMNLANMQVARTAARRREVAIRISVGASRFRLIRQFLTESVLLASAGGLAGILVAYWSAAAFKHMQLPMPFPVDFDITPDWRTLVLTIAVAVACGIGFGISPAMVTTRTDLTLRRYRTFGTRNLTMLSQVAGSLILILVTGFMIIGFQNSNRLDIAFDPRNMFLMSVDPVRDGYTPDRTATLAAKLPDTLKRAPGVDQVVLAEAPPYIGLIGDTTITAPSDPGSPDRAVQGIAKQRIGPNYFAALSVPILRGREFDTRDERVVVLNQLAARQLFADLDPIGRRVRESSHTYEVIGVAKTMSAPLSPVGTGAATTTEVPTLYLPFTRTDFAQAPVGGITILVRSARGSESLAGVRRELSALDPDLVIFNVRSLAEHVSEATAAVRLNTIVYGLIGLFSLALALVGLAGVTAYSVARRSKEIGIRMALGARRDQVLRLVMSEGGWLVAVGSVIGMLGGIAAARALGAITILFGPSFAA